MIREILESERYQVLEAWDGREALEKIEKMKPDLALLDIQMPALDGFTRRFRSKILYVNRAYEGFGGGPAKVSTRICTPG